MVRCVIHIQTCSAGLVRSLHFAVIKNKTIALREWTRACESARTHAQRCESSWSLACLPLDIVDVVDGNW